MVTREHLVSTFGSDASIVAVYDVLTSGVATRGGGYIPLQMLVRWCKGADAGAIAEAALWFTSGPLRLLVLGLEYVDDHGLEFEVRPEDVPAVLSSGSVVNPMTGEEIRGAAEHVHIFFRPTTLLYDLSPDRRCIDD